MHFSLYDLYGHALAQEPRPQGHEIYNFGRSFLGHHYHILSLPYSCSRVGKKIVKEILTKTHFALYEFNSPVRAQVKITSQGVMKYTIMVDTSLVVITIDFSYFNCLIHARE